MFCQECKKELSGKQRKFCSPKCKGKPHQNNSYKKQQERGKKRKQYFIDKSGGKCTVCGYNKNNAALSFHHIDPKTKSFGMDYRTLSNNSLEVLEAEYKKCILLCLNCHSELHHPEH